MEILKHLSNLYTKFLLILIAFHTALFFIWNGLDRSFQTWDSAGHIGMAYTLADQIRYLFSGQIGFVDFIKTSDYYPPLIQTFGAILTMLFGNSSELLLFLTLFFFILSIVMVFIVVDLVFKNKKLAFFTALIFSLFPEVYEQSRVFHLDLPLISLLLLSLYFFIKSKGLIDTKNAIFFGIFFAFVQLTKWYGFIFLIVPCLYIWYINLDDLKKRSGEFILNILIVSGLVVTIAVPWYILNYAKLREYSAIFSTGEIDDPVSFWSGYNLLYYPTRVLSHGVFFIPFIFIILSLINLFIRNKKIFTVAFITIFIPYLVFTIIGNKNLRYVFPLMPLFAFLVADLLYRLPSKINLNVSKGLKIFLGIYLVVAFFFTSFNQIKPQSSILKPIGVVLSGPTYWGVWYYEPQLFSYDPSYWPIKDAWDFIIQDETATGNPESVIGVTPLFDKKKLSLATFELMRREKNYDKAFVPVPYFQFEPFKTDEEIRQYLDDNSVKYVLVTEDPGPVGLRNYKVLKQMADYFLSNRNRTYEEIKSYELPDGYNLKIFKKLPPGQELDYRVTAQCIPDAGLGDGIETIALKRNHTYVFYTGHFSVGEYQRDFVEGNLYIAEIRNIPHESNLDVYNLPQSGTSMCIFSGINVDLSEAIERPLLEPNNCAVDCQTVTHFKWSVGDEDYDETIYSRDDFSVESYGILEQ